MIDDQQMAVLPIKEIRRFLVNDKRIRAAIQAGYDIELTDDPEVLSKRLVEALDQIPHENPAQETVSNSEVLKAAVLAIASSSANWATIQKKRAAIKSALCQYDPLAVTQAPEFEIRNELIRLLPGQNQTANADAMIKWAVTLSENKDYYKEVICRTYLEITEHPSWFAIDSDKHFPMAVLSLAGIFANPVNRWRKLKPYKFHGMQVPIACEFLRNLGWSGFKPDRHVIRAIALWEAALKEKHGDAVEKAFCHLVDIVDTTSKTILCPIKSAVYAVHATPAGMDYSEADNLLWAFISNVVNLRQKDIVNVWLKDQIDMTESSFDMYDRITKLDTWPNSLICEE
jgi:hypothetical protein